MEECEFGKVTVDLEIFAAAKVRQMFVVFRLIMSLKLLTILKVRIIL